MVPVNHTVFNESQEFPPYLVGIIERSEKNPIIDSLQIYGMVSLILILILYKSIVLGEKYFQKSQVSQTVQNPPDSERILM